MKRAKNGGPLGPLELAFSRRQIIERIEGLVQEIAGYYRSPIMERARSDGLLVVGVIKGVKPFVRELVPRLRSCLPEIPIEKDFIQVRTRDQEGHASEPSILRDVACVAGRHVLLVDDIVDGEATLRFLSLYLAVCRSSKTLTTCVLLRRKSPDPMPVNFVGFVVSRPEWLVGFGLDCKIGQREIGRRMPDIWYMLRTGGG